MTFETSALIALCEIMLSIAILYRIKLWCNSICVEADILGYKWFKNNKTTGFSPVIAFKNNENSMKTPIHELNLLIPERKLRLRLSKNLKRSVKTNITHLIFLLTLLLFVSYTLGAPINQNNNNILLLIIVFYAASITFGLAINFKNTGQLNIMSFMPISKRPENYEELNEDYFKRIEESDLVTYEEAMAHYYHQNKKSEKWLYPLIAIGIVAIIAYKILG